MRVKIPLRDLQILRVPETKVQRRRGKTSDDVKWCALNLVQEVMEVSPVVLNGSFNRNFHSRNRQGKSCIWSTCITEMSNSGDLVYDTDLLTRTYVTWWPFSPAREGSAKIDPHRDRSQTESLRGGSCRQWTNFMCHRQSNSRTYGDFITPEAIESSTDGTYRIERYFSKTGIILPHELLPTQRHQGTAIHASLQATSTLYKPWKHFAEHNYSAMQFYPRH